MHVFIVYVSVATAMFTASIDAQLCGSTLHVDGTDIGVRLDGHLITELVDGLHLHECAGQCISITNCLSINYARNLGICQLNSANRSHVDVSDVVANASFIYVDIELWPKRPSDLCSTKPCSGKERCLSLGNSYKCVTSDCTAPLFNTNGASVLPGPTTIGSTREYACLDGTMMQGNREITCTGTSWTTPQFTCEYVRSCADLKTCNPGYTDGEYWLYPPLFGTTPVKIFCYGMTTSDPSAFITVSPSENHSLNGAVSAASQIRLDFTKIAIDIETMIVNRTILTFASVSGTGTRTMTYGHAADCEPNSPTLGTFRIDTSTTGLIVDTTLNWKAFGHQPSMKDFARTNGGSVISARCGGYCGWCEPDGDMTLQLNTGYVVDPSSATTPSCL